MISMFFFIYYDIKNEKNSREILFFYVVVMIWILACSLLLQVVCSKYSIPNVPDYLTEMSLQYISHKTVSSKHYQLAMCITSDSNVNIPFHCYF